MVKGPRKFTRRATGNGPFHADWTFHTGSEPTELTNGGVVIIRPKHAGKEKGPVRTRPKEGAKGSRKGGENRANGAEGVAVHRPVPFQKSS